MLLIIVRGYSLDFKRNQVMLEQHSDYPNPWSIPAMNKFMGMQGFQLTGTQLVRFYLKKPDHIEMLGLHYQDTVSGRHVIVCTDGIGGSDDGEYTTGFKMCPVKSPSTKPLDLTYSKYPLCALFWKFSVSGRKWDGEQPFSDSYIAQGSLTWKLAIHEVYKFSL